MLDISINNTHNITLTNVYLLNKTIKIYFSTKY